jgi:hypothetical protein
VKSAQFLEKNCAKTYNQKDKPTPTSRGVNVMDNFRFESASVFVFEDMVCAFRNPPDMDVDADSSQTDIRQIRYRILSDGYGLSAIFLRIIQGPQ